MADQVAVQEERGAEYESQHVHDVYEQIASHFSATRYKPWPIIEQFLKELPAGSVGLDIGCGNGKYLAVNPEVFIVGSDRSHNLTKFAAAHQPHSAVVADIMSLPHQHGKFDFAISIAVLHHLSTPERRVQAMQAVLETLRPGGRALIYVWALEQKDSRRGWDEGHEQDVMVPWVMHSLKPKSKKQPKGKQARNNPSNNDEGAVKTAEQEQTQPATLPEEDKTFHRYYHLYRKGELVQDFETAGGIVVQDGYDRDNWWAVAERKQG